MVKSLLIVPGVHPFLINFQQALCSVTISQHCMHPRLTIETAADCLVQMAGGVLDETAQERLPSSSTCINLLKLPPYRSAEAVRDKLLFAIRNVAGFDLS